MILFQTWIFLSLLFIYLSVLFIEVFFYHNYRYIHIRNYKTISLSLGTITTSLTYGVSIILLVCLYYFSLSMSSEYHNISRRYISSWLKNFLIDFNPL